jgi:hypothetical protein
MHNETSLATASLATIDQDISLTATGLLLWAFL